MLLRHLTTRMLLNLLYSVRALSGFIWIAGCLYGRGHPLAVPLLMLSRFVYGLTLSTFNIPNIWVGVRFETIDRALALARLHLIVGFGIMAGPVIGTLIAG